VGYEAAQVRAPLQHTAATPSGSESGRLHPGAALSLCLVAPAHQAQTSGPALLLPQSPGAGVAFWVAVPLAGLLIDLAARRSGGTVATAEEAARFLSTSKVAHVALVVAWAFAGYHLFAR
jgi:hypothetical protein